MKLIDNEDKDIIITGDLNCNFIEHTQNQATSKLIDIIDIFQLQQHIHKNKNRKSICLMNGKKSHAREIRCGVPQGSNLGPILFFLYINDLPKCLETTKANLFADDTNLLCAGLDANEIETKLKRS